MQRPLISSKSVIRKIVTDLGLGGQEIPWQDIVEWIGEGLQHIGAVGQLVEQVTDLEVSGFRAKLPGDFFSARPNNHLAYQLRGDSLLVGFSEGLITGFTYLAFPLDEEGFPLVPDNISYATALFWKVAMQLAIRGELLNKELSFATCKSRWDWYCRQAGTQGQYSPGFAQRFASQITSRIPIISHYDQSFGVVNGSILAPIPSPLPAIIPQQFIPKPTA